METRGSGPASHGQRVQARCLQIGVAMDRLVVDSTHFARRKTHAYLGTTARLGNLLGKEEKKREDRNLANHVCTVYF